MDRQQANEESKRRNPGSRSLRCIWYCGKINEEIRKAATSAKVPLWRVAVEMGISEPTMTRKLRIELPAEEKQHILNIIKQVKEG